MTDNFDLINQKMKEIIDLMIEDNLTMLGGTYDQPYEHWKYKIELPAKYRHKLVKSGMK